MTHAIFVIFLLALWAGAVACVASIAKHKGRNPWLWGIGSVFFWLPTLVVLLIAGTTEAEQIRRVERDELARP